MHPEFDYKEFSEAIKAKRGREDTLRSMSDQTGVSVATLSRVMQGKCSSVETILKVCYWLKQPITDFIVIHGELFRQISASELKRRRNPNYEYII